MEGYLVNFCAIKILKTYPQILTSVIVSVLLATNVNAAEELDAQNIDFSHHATSLEVGGAGLLYSISYTYRFENNLYINPALEPNPNKLPEGVVILYGGYLLGGQSHFVDLRLGLGVATNGFVLPGVGLLYTYWPHDGGFHFKIGAYVFKVDGQDDEYFTIPEWLPWPALSFGYAF